MYISVERDHIDWSEIFGDQFIGYIYSEYQRVYKI